MPVSYTHLDVYKRQVAALRDEILQRGGNCLGAITVSYTHLDVYKRQVIKLGFTNKDPQVAADTLNKLIEEYLVYLSLIHI